MEEDVRIAAEVARPFEWPIVVLELAEAAVWRIRDGFVGWGVDFFGRENINDEVLEV